MVIDAFLRQAWHRLIKVEQRNSFKPAEAAPKTSTVDAGQPVVDAEREDTVSSLSSPEMFTEEQLERGKKISITRGKNYSTIIY